MQSATIDVMVSALDLLTYAGRSFGLLLIFLCLYLGYYWFFVLRKKKRNEDIYISILKLIHSKELTGVTLDELLELAHKLGYLSSEEVETLKVAKNTNDVKHWETVSDNAKDIWTKINRLMEEALFPGWYKENKDRKLILKFDSRFKLIEYQELEEARDNAKEARFFSLVAIFFALLTLQSSTVFTVVQLRGQLELQEKNDPVNVKVVEDQIEEFRSYFSNLEQSLAPLTEPTPEASASAFPQTIAPSLTP